MGECVGECAVNVLNRFDESNEMCAVMRELWCSIDLTGREAWVCTFMRSHYKREPILGEEVGSDIASTLHVGYPPAVSAGWQRVSQLLRSIRCDS